MSLLTTIEHLRDLDIFSDLDIHFAKFIASLSGSKDDALLLGAVLASHFTTVGSSCVDLNAMASQSFPQLPELGINTLSCPSLPTWLNVLQNSSVVGAPGDYAPLILDKHRLYLYRYWNYEQRLAAQIRARIGILRSDIKHDVLQDGLSRLFPAQADYQKNAALTAVRRNFCIISGGPGSGKTVTVVKILALLLEQNPNLNIALAAPTGKATIRLQEAIRQTLLNLNCAPSIKVALMDHDTYTIHRLLGSKPNSPYFRSHAGNILPYDVVVVDEASMVDLALMTKLAQAIPKSARWILLGDKDQLASVEAGTVLGDICEVSQTQELGNYSIHDNIVLLNKSYRFAENSGIWQLAQAVKQGESKNALQILKSDKFPELSWHPLGLSEALPTFLIEKMAARLSRCLFDRQLLPEIILQEFNQFCVLCATRHGYLGVEGINRRIEEKFRAKGLIRAGTAWYHGRPIMITRNDYTLKLFNGDVGIILKNPEEGNELQAFFPSSEGGCRTFWINSLPEHETVFAMTIHKSQGSEFDQVLMLLPEKLSPVLTRELVYTGITRARQRVTVWGNEAVFLAAVSQKINRSSGLREYLSF